MLDWDHQTINCRATSYDSSNAPGRNGGIFQLWLGSGGYVEMILRAYGASITTTGHKYAWVIRKISQLYHQYCGCFKLVSIRLFCFSSGDGKVC